MRLTESTAVSSIHAPEPHPAVGGRAADGQRLARRHHETAPDRAVHDHLDLRAARPRPGVRQGQAVCRAQHAAAAAAGQAVARRLPGAEQRAVGLGAAPVAAEHGLVLGGRPAPQHPRLQQETLLLLARDLPLRGHRHDPRAHRDRAVRAQQRAQETVAAAGNPGMGAMEVEEVVRADHAQLQGVGQLQNPVVGPRQHLQQPVAVPALQPLPLLRGQPPVGQQRAVGDRVHLDGRIAGELRQCVEQPFQPGQVRRPLPAESRFAHHVRHVDHVLGRGGVKRQAALALHGTRS